MKSLIINSLSCLLVLSFAAACGKKGGSGGGSNKNNVFNPITGTANGTKAYDTLKAWQSGSAEASVVGLHAYYLRAAPQFFTTGMCTTAYAPFNACTNPSGCFKHTNAGIQLGSVKMKTGILNSKAYEDCDITATFSLYSKAGNTALSEAVLGNAGAGKHLIKNLTQQTGSIFKVYYGAFDGATSPTSYAIINTSLPSIVNPTEVGTIMGGPSEKLQDFRQGY